MDAADDQSLRFIFDTSGGTPEVRGPKTGKTWSFPGLRESGETNEDYVLISRLLNSASGEFVIAAGAGSGWKKRSQQLLFHVQVIGATAGPPELIALHEW